MELNSHREAVLTGDEKPAHIIHPSGIAPSLRAILRWIVWGWVRADGRWTKIPKQSQDPSRNASSTNPETWSDFETAVACATRCKMGLGLILAGDGVIGIDLDDCRDPSSGDIAGWAQDILDHVKSYAEVSPSLTGVKLFVRGVLPDGCRKKHPRPEGGEVELYSTGRFFCVTGQRVYGSPDDVRDCQTGIDGLLSLVKSWRPEQPAVSPVLPLSTSSGDRDSSVNRARAYLAQVPGAVSGSGGHNHTFIQAKRLAGFGLNREDALALLAEWNSKCEPPWNERELEHKIESAFKSGSYAMPDRDFQAYLDVSPSDPFPDDATGERQKPDVAQAKTENAAVDVERVQEFRQLLQRALKRLNDGYKLDDLLPHVKFGIDTIANDAIEVDFRTMTAAQLDAAELKTDYLVDGILAANQPCIIAASKKSLKTTVAIDLTLSLASRSMFLGKFYVPKAVRVALMSGESGDAVIQETARRIARSKPWVNLSEYENSLFSFSLPSLGQPKTRASLIKFVRTNEIAVLIIDPAYLCLELGDDAGNLFTVGKKLFELTEVGRETGCTIVIVHHNRKAQKDNQFAPPELESIAWSGFQEWARQWILLGRREAYNPERSGSHRLWLSVGGSAGHSGLWGVDIEEGSLKDERGRRWDISVDGASTIISDNISQNENAKAERAELKATKQTEADAAKLLIQYQSHPNGETEKFYRERSRLSGTRAGLANDKLVADGLIESCEVVKGNRTFPGFKLSSGPSGLIGTDRDSIGTSPASPDQITASGLIPIRVSPDPDHRDCRQSPRELDFDQIDGAFGNHSV